MLFLFLGCLLLITTKFTSSLGSYHSPQRTQTWLGSRTVNSQSNTNSIGDAYWGKAEINYSAANEYIQAHYGEEAPRKPNYFVHQSRIESIYDARQGVRITENMNGKSPANLKQCGFTLLSSSSYQKNETVITDWNNLDQIQDLYLPQLQQLLTETYETRGRTIRHVIFWNPMLRGKDYEQLRPPSETKITPTAGFASTPHIDMDINAYETLEDFLGLLENNEISSSSSDGDRRRQEIIHDIRDNHCGFAVVNAWRNVGSSPVTNDPLGIFAVQYDDSLVAFPEAAPNMDRSKWYVFSDMMPNEILLFCQYDRDVTWPSDLWHCSLTRHNERDYPSRESFDLRCFIVFNNAVPLDQDRYKVDRMSSLLTLEESGCFCEDQFVKRSKNPGDPGIHDSI
jgi:hypothetical protein